MISPLLKCCDGFPGASLHGRRDCDHLCGGQQQLQHGNKGRQRHKPATGSSGPLPQYLEQQVSLHWYNKLKSMRYCCFFSQFIVKGLGT